MALVEDGDWISLNATTNSIHLHVEDALLSLRRDKWVRPAAGAAKGVLLKYIRTVSDASKGCITDLEETYVNERETSPGIA
ncbi:Dihydroxy-acid dehydratase [compost metagenome]